MTSRLVCAARVLFAVALIAGCASTGAQPPIEDAAADPPPAADPPLDIDPDDDDSVLKRHAESGLEGLIVGTVVGAQMGGGHPIAAAAGAILFGLYALVTGDVPLVDDRQRERREDPRRALEEDEIADQLDRQDQLEDEIEAELRRQEELLDAINQQETLNEAIREEQQRRVRAQDTDEMSAPAPPYERQIPESLFEIERGVDGVKGRVAKTLDADRDGRPEIEMVFDEKSGELVERSEDTNYDGKLDAHNRYENGRIAERSEDSNHDGKPDRWTEYENEHGTRVEVDRDYDGKRDGFYIYEQGSLEREEHDTNGDGRIDRRVEYEGRRRSVEIEDLDHNGKMDVWTHFDQAGRAVRVEKDTDSDGKVDVWEHYEGSKPDRMKIAHKEEDLDSDGSVDVKSHYENGKLSRKEILNPDALH